MVSCQALACLADLRARYWQAWDRGDPQLDALARQYRAAWRRRDRWSGAASSLIDQALKREQYHTEQAQRARAIRAALEAAFVPKGVQDA